MFFFPWSRDEAEARWIQDSWSVESPIVTQWRCVKHQGGRQSQLFCSKGASKQRRFWATHVNRKWTYSLLICLVASKFVLLRVFSLIETICPKICSKSSLKSAKSPLPVDARPSKWSLLFGHHQSTIVVPKKWEILWNAPSTENPWKLFITTYSLELCYSVI